MILFGAANVPGWLPLLVVLGVALCLAVWGYVGWQVARRQPLVPYQPRRLVPWKFSDLLVILAVLIAFQTVAGNLVHYCLLVHGYLGRWGLDSLGLDSSGRASSVRDSSLHDSFGLCSSVRDSLDRASSGGDSGSYFGGRLTGSDVPSSPLYQALPKTPAQQPNVHPIAKVLVTGDPLLIVLAVASAVVAAPLAEEFFFRLLLQGWLERAWKLRCRRWRALRRLFPGAIGPILLSSGLFALLHVRPSPLPWTPEYAAVLIMALKLAELAAMLFAICWLCNRGQMFARLLAAVSFSTEPASSPKVFRKCRDATAADLGWSREQLWADLVLGVLVFVALSVPLYAMQIGLSRLLPSEFAADPITLFPFAIVLGWLYHRTHRLAPVVALHTALNATSLLIAGVTLEQGP